MANYIINLKNSQTYNKRIHIFTCLLIIAIFFPIHHTFFTKEAYLTGDYSDFTAFSLYLSDIFLFVTWFLVILPRGGNDFWSRIKDKGLKIPILWLILLIFCAFIAHFGLNIRLNVYLLLKWLELIVAYGTFSVLFEQNSIKTSFLKLFSWLCGLESIIALTQFAKQSSLGLYKIGESHLGSGILGVAKIVSGGTTFIRGYGTFPHPNPFSAFLVMGVLITIYLLTNAITTKWRIFYSILLFLNILGLTVTFSRGAYLALAVGLVTYFGFSFLWRHSEGVQPTDLSADLSDEALAKLEALAKVGESPSSIKISFTSHPFGYAQGALSPVERQMHSGFRMTPIIIVIISIIISFFLFKPFLITRATFSDQSTIARKFYDVTGVKMAIKNPVFGVGLGESLLHMEQYIGKSLAPWDKQPPHNYFIIAAAELGIPAMLVLIWIFLSHLWGLTKKLRANFSPYLLSLFSIFLSFLLLMQFDHYFYTLQQTQLLLWILLALIGTEIKTKNEPAAKI